MAEKNEVSVQVGPGFCGTLAIVFIILKLMHVIEWSWLWVLSPIWIPTIFGLLIFGFLVIIAAID